MSLASAIEKRASRILSRSGKGMRQAGDETAGKIGKDVVTVAGKVHAEVQELLGKAEKAFAKRSFDVSVSEYRNALAAYETPADAKAVVSSVGKQLEAYAGQFQLLPWRKADKVAARFAKIQADASQVARLGGASSIIEKSGQALFVKDRKTFEELYTYARDLLERIWFPYNYNYTSATRSRMTAKVENESWLLAEHYVKAGHGDKAAAFFASAKAPTISRPTFERELREVLLYDKYGAMKDFTESQAWELALAARNKFRFGGGKIEETQEALLQILKLSLKNESKTMPPATVVSWLLNHARTPEEAGALLDKAQKLGYQVSLKRDILGAITTPPLAGVTIDGTSAAVQAVNPTALVTLAEKNGFGAEASSTLMMALHGQPRYSPRGTPNVTLGGLVADALNLGR
jgi:hypothetical protein